MLNIKRFKITIMAHVEYNEERHHFTERKGRFAATFEQAIFN
ncbi:hypothetical protein PSI14_17040 [Xenorhabdus sp. XENO-2]|uniref:Transposase n=1 Tax=Xenorhabdus anantnagensis TaxID=3025875 RepID=A0ABT5LVP7_9GAMM|nr:hypothetical protein [Xenorhabdus anantnagensis]MDC9598496.1 hypothetical protein [Xenorhabdus anantnagensis]